MHGRRIVGAFYIVWFQACVVCRQLKRQGGDDDRS
jgi:hypothetical protein